MYQSQVANQTLLLNKGAGGKIYRWSNRRQRFLDKIDVLQRLRESQPMAFASNLTQSQQQRTVIPPEGEITEYPANQGSA
jgi:hypothetical protein